MFRRVLIANRGEIALRIHNTLYKLGIESIMIYHEVEKDAMYHSVARKAFSLGGGSLKDTFLNISKIIDIAKHARVDAIHPGYGFLSENADFSEACLHNKIVFIGSTPSVIELMANKQKANSFVHGLGLPIIPQIKGSVSDILGAISNDFFPCIIKASGGGGGKGMHVVNSVDLLSETLEKASREAINYFGKHEVFVERFLGSAKHIEVQILADDKGNVIHLHERDCSLQRRYQKVIEEAPALSLKGKTRERLFEYALKIARESKYTGAGTVEFLVDENDQVYFLEMNTRLQVEHGVTELVTGVDIVEEQLRIASGESITRTQSDISIEGHALEARVYTENPHQGFSPSPGIVKYFKSIESENVRVDHAMQSGSEVFSNFDPLIAKVLVKSKSRNSAIQLMGNTLSQISLHAPATNLSFLSALLKADKFNSNVHNTVFIDSNLESLLKTAELEGTPKDILKYALAGVVLSLNIFPGDEGNSSLSSLFISAGRWRIMNELSIILNKGAYIIQVIDWSTKSFSLRYMGDNYLISDCDISSNEIKCTINQETFKTSFSRKSDNIWILGNGLVYMDFERNDILDEIAIEKNLKELNSPKKEGWIESPLTGKIIKVSCSNGKKVQKGEVLLVIESMKMENNILAPTDGMVTNLMAKSEQLVDSGSRLLYIE